MKPLTRKQKQVYDFIVSHTSENGYPPAIREICVAVGLSSPSSVHAHLKSLQELGYIQRGDRKTRALAATDRMASGRVPVLGRVTAGLPALAVEETEEFLPFDTEGMHGDFFALRVEGDSMTGAGILDGDYVIVRKQEGANSGEIVVALLEDEATVKRLLLRNGEVWFMPENDAYAPIDGEGCGILGVVRAVFRRY
ncbi:transcriptional repressor LexA [Oscillospiraceae bacterium OttesenSCG-928-F05]|nr:transcriptional repressor LexA [Oscillospiraceae bacterium OttesenSCG-928-F05]